MRAAPFTYHRPATLAAALALNATLDDARLLAGGQTLMPMVAMRVAQPAHLIDLNGIADLQGIAVDAGRVTIGAMTRQSALARSDLLASHAPMLREALAHVGSRATRNRGTLGGSLCHLDPAAELPVVMAALDACVTLSDRGGVRTLPFALFAADALSPALAPGEIMTAVDFAVPPIGCGQAFIEVAARFGATALVTVAAVIERATSGRIACARVALGGATGVPTRLGALEADIAADGRLPCVEDAALSLAEIDMIDDPLVPTGYRRKVAATLVARAFAAAAARTH